MMWLAIKPFAPVTRTTACGGKHESEVLAMRDDGNLDLQIISDTKMVDLSGLNCPLLRYCGGVTRYGEAPPPLCVSSELELLGLFAC